MIARIVLGSVMVYIHPIQRPSTLFGFCSTLVNSRNLKDSIYVDLDLRYAARSRKDSRRFELSKRVIVVCHGALSFIDINEDSRLIVALHQD
jgi:hypothetical protein